MELSPKIFQKGGALVIVENNGNSGGYKINNLSRGYLKELLAEAAYFVVERRRSDGGIAYVSCYPHDSIVASIIDANAEWIGIPFLKGLTNTPIPRSDGTFNSIYGYDYETGYYFTPGLTVPETSIAPTKKDA